MKGKTIVGWVSPNFPESENLVKQAGNSGLNLISIDSVPRITTAQKMDVLSSVGKIAGYRAVIEAVHKFQSFLAPQITAAGSILRRKFSSLVPVLPVSKQLVRRIR